MHRLFGAILIALALLLTLPFAVPFAARAEGPAPTPFRAWDVVIDTGGSPLAAWQIDVRLGATSLLVGVEGGAGIGSAPEANAASPFAEPPHHDPAALQSGRVVLAAFSTAAREDLPRGAVRVARLHVRVGDDASALDHAAVLEAAAGPDGRRIPATVTLRPAES